MMAEVLLDRSFAALGHPVRRAIVARLASGDTTVNELANPFAISLPAISRHLRVLERAGLVAQEREGQFRRCRLNGEGLNEAYEWLEFHRRFWSESLDRLEEHLNASAKTKRQSKGTRHGSPRSANRKR